MVLFKKEFIDERREEFMNLIAKIQYEVKSENIWVDAKEQSRTIEGNVITFTLLFDNTLQSSHTITGLRLLDSGGAVIAARDLSIEVNSAQTVLFELKISYEEV